MVQLLIISNKVVKVWFCYVHVKYLEKNMSIIYGIIL